MSRTIRICLAVMWGMGLLVFVSNPEQWVSGWGGWSSVIGAYVLSIIAVLEPDF